VFGDSAEEVNGIRSLGGSRYQKPTLLNFMYKPWTKQAAVSSSNDGDVNDLDIIFGLLLVHSCILDPMNDI